MNFNSVPYASSSTPAQGSSFPSTSMAGTSSMPPSLGGPVNDGLLLHQFTDYLTSIPQRLDHPLVVALGDSDTVFTHCLGGNVFGSAEAIKDYQRIMETINSKWPALAQAIEAQEGANRVAVFVMRDCEALAKIGAGGHWGQLTALEPELKNFISSIFVDVNKGTFSVAATGHEWTHEIQSFRQALLSGQNPGKPPVSLTAFLNNADASEVVNCWRRGFQEYKIANDMGRIPAGDVRHTIYGKPANHWRDYQRALFAGDRGTTAETWSKFTSEIGTHLAEGRLKQGFQAVQEHAGELCKTIDDKLRIKLFTAPQTTFASELWSLTKRWGMRGLAVLAYGLDVYHEHSQLPETDPNRNMNGLINGTTRHILGMGMFYSHESMSAEYDTTRFGSSADAMRQIRTIVGAERLQEILTKGNAWSVSQANLCSTDPYSPVPVIFSMKGDQTLSDEERSIYLYYMNAQNRSIQEAIQGPLTWLYGEVKNSVCQLFRCHAVEPVRLLNVVNMIGAGVRDSLVTRDLWSPNDLVQGEARVRERVNEIVGSLPRREPALPAERAAEAMPSLQPEAAVAGAHFTYAIPDQEEPAAEHPLLTDLKATQQEIQKLTAEVESAIQEGRVVPESTLKKIDQLVNKCEGSKEHLQKCWDKKEEYYAEAMKSVGVLANQLYHHNEQSRAEHAQNTARKAQQRAIDHYTRELRRGARPHMSYVNCDNYAYDQFYPQGRLTQTILEVRRDTRDQLARLNELQDRRSTREGALESSNQLLSDMHRNDKAYSKAMESELKRQQKIAGGLRDLSMLIGTAAGVMSAYVCPPAYVATAVAAHGISQFAQSIVGKGTDRLAARMQRRQTTSLHMQQRAAQTAHTQQQELGIIEGQLQQCHQILLSQTSWSDAKGFRENLETVISERQTKIDKHQEEIDKLTDVLEVDDPKHNKVCVNEMVKLWEDNVKEAKDSLKRKPHSRTRKDKLAEEKLGLNYWKERQLDYETRRTTATNLRNDLIEDNTADARRLEQERFLAPMKEQIEAIILKEEARFDFERHLVDNEALGIKAGDLTERGLAQRTMRINFAWYNHARMQERQLMLGSTQAAKGLSNELSYFLGTQKPTFAVDLFGQLYRIYDLQKHFRESAIPQFEEFIKVLKLDDGRQFLEKLQALNTVEFVTGFLIPGVQILTACLAVVRLGQAIRSTQRLSPEQQFILDVVEHAFKEHQKFLNEQFGQLKDHLDRNHAELTEELNQLRCDVNSIGQELYKAVESSKKEILEELHSQEFQSFKFEVDTLAGQWLERDRIFWNQFPDIPDEHKERAVLAYLAKLEAALPTCMAEHLNGLTAKGYKEGWQSRFKPECLAEGPQYMTRAIALELGLTGPVPNRHLFTVLYGCIKTVGRSCSYNDFNRVKMRLDHLRSQLEAYKARLIQLGDLRRSALESAMQARELYIQNIRQVIERMHLNGLAMQQAMVRGQIKALLSEHEQEWLGTARIGERKFLLSQLVHHMPIGPDNYTPTMLLINTMYDAQVTHGFAKTAGKVGGGAGGALGIPGGPPIIGILAAGGGLAGYLGTTVLGNVTYGIVNIAQAAFKGLSDPLMKETFDGSLHSLLGSRCDISTKRWVQSRWWGGSVSPKGWVSNKGWEIRVWFSNVSQRYQVSSLTLRGRNADDELISANKRLPKPRNARSLIAFKTGVESRYGRKPVFKKKSYIREQDAVRIPPAPDSKDYAQRSLGMLRSYFDCLRSIQTGRSMAENNPFIAIGQESHFIHCSTGEFLPLALPKVLLQAMEQKLLADNLELMASGTSSLVPSFYFRKEPSGHRYEFVLEYRSLKGGKLEEYGSFQLATFDRAVVESFTQVTFPKPKEKKDLHDFAFSKPNLQEFLIQAFYGSLFGFGLPGKGTFRLTNAELFVPREVPSLCLHALFAFAPNRTVHYTSEFAGGNPQELLGEGPVFRRGRHSFHILRDAKQDKLKPEQDKRELTPLEQAAADYSRKYHLAKALCKLFSNVDPVSLDELFGERLGLFSPTKPEIAQAHAFLHRIQSVPALTQAASASTVTQETELLDQGLFNVGNSCWMNVCLQWLHKFPGLRHNLMQELRTEGKQAVAERLHYTLESYRSSAQPLLLDELRTELFTSNIYTGEPTGLHDPADLLAGRIGPRETPSYISYEANRRAPLSSEVRNAFGQRTNGLAVEAPGFVVVERKRANPTAGAIVPESQSIMVGEIQYAIVGLIEHVQIPVAGGNIGHYIAYTRDENAWTRYDDSSVSPERQPPLATAAFYLLRRV